MRPPVQGPNGILPLLHFPVRAALLPTLFALTLPLAGCFEKKHSSAAAIVIALEAPLTGAQTSNGQDMLRGVQLAVEEVNRAGGVLGRPVVLVSADDRADPTQALAVAARVKQEGAVAVIGPYNSGVGLVTLPQYTRDGIVPVHLTSSDDTTGQGVTLQPKNSQISPPEIAYIAALQPTTVALLVDPSAYTSSMAQRMEAGLMARGITAIRLAITPGRADYTDVVRQSLDLQPQVVYVSTYFPEGGLIAKALATEAAGGRNAACFMGLANQDPDFVATAGIADSRRCVFSGVPEPDQMPSATNYAAAYRARFSGTNPGVWGTFTYDSAKLLFRAMTEARTTSFEPVLVQLRATTNYLGATGPITIDPQTGNRPNVPVRILGVNASGNFVVLP